MVDLSIVMLVYQRVPSGNFFKGEDQGFFCSEQVAFPQLCKRLQEGIWGIQALKVEKNRDSTVANRDLAIQLIKWEIQLG